MRSIQAVGVAGILILGCAAAAWADAPANGTGAAAQIVLPKGDDDYARLAARAAAGDKATDFHALRLAYLKSAQHAAMDSAAEEQLLRQMRAAHENYAYQQLFDASVKLLSVHYASMEGHKYLAEACSKLRDPNCAMQAVFVQGAMVNSILHSGDGRGCATGWEVISADEEDFMMSMLRASDVKRTHMAGGCDQLDLNAGGVAKTYFYRVTGA